MLWRRFHGQPPAHPSAPLPGAAYYNLVMSRSSLVGYWRLNEITSNTAYDSKGQNEGIYVNAPTLGSVGPLAVEPSLAATFTASQSEYVEIKHNATLNIFTADWSWICWFTAPVVPATAGTLFHKGRVGLDGGPLVILHAVVDGSVSASADGFGLGCHSSQLVNDTKWHQVAVTFQAAGSNWLMYVDGKDVTVFDANSPTSNSGQPLEFGRRSDNVRFQDGGMAEQQLYSSRLTAGDIASDYVIGRALFPWAARYEPTDDLAET